MAKIGLDVGHGKNTFPANGKGVTVGGVGYAEFDFNQRVGKKLKSLLEKVGHTVILGQPFDSNDVSLTTRSNKYNAEKVDIVVSIHADANNNADANGRYYFYWHADSKGKKLAQSIAKFIKAKGYDLRTTDGSIASVPETWTDFHMVRETVAPAVLGENGFMTGNKDFDLIFGSKKNEYARDVAESYFQGIQEYFGLSTVVTPVVAVSNTFKKGDIVELKSSATHWIKFYEKVGGVNKGRTYISDNLKDAQFKVTYLNSDGTIELAETLNSKARYVAYERDLVKAELRLYTVQTGAFASKDNAVKKAEELKKEGHDTFITEK